MATSWRGETVLGMMRAMDRNLVVLAGDTHNAWASDLADLRGNAVGVEFATPGVTSPGLEAFFTTENPLAVAAGLTQLIGPLQYADTAASRLHAGDGDARRMRRAVDLL